jgi:rubrerythrin
MVLWAGPSRRRICMTTLGNAREVVGFERKISKSELARALRMMIADEYEAVQIYSQVAEAIDDAGIKAVILDIVREEQRHAGQFWDLLTQIEPYEVKAFEMAVAENKEIQGKAKGRKRSRK